MPTESIVTSALNSVLLMADILTGDVVEGLLSSVSEAGIEKQRIVIFFRHSNS